MQQLKMLALGCKIRKKQATLIAGPERASPTTLNTHAVPAPRAYAAYNLQVWMVEAIGAAY